MAGEGTNSAPSPGRIVFLGCKGNASGLGDCEESFLEVDDEMLRRGGRHLVPSSNRAE